MRSLVMIAATATALAAPCTARAQTHDVDELAKKTQNPVGDIASLPLQNNFNFGSGDYGRMQYLLNVQPVKPVHLNESWNLIVRPIIPLLSQPVNASERQFGLGDIQLQTYFTPRDAGAFVWGVGPIVQLPTRTAESLGNGMWGGGVGAILVHTSGPWVIGAMINHVWSIGSSSLTRHDFSLTTLQPFVNYNFGGGWAVSVSSTTTADWALSGQQWTVPLGATITKTFVLNQQPMSLGVGAFYNVVRPDNAADWQLKVQYSLIFPEPKR